MRIRFEKSKLQKLIEDKQSLAKKHGVDFSKKLLKRLNELKAFKDVGELMQSGLDSPHFLSGELKNCIAWDIDANKRLILGIGILPHQTLDADYIYLDEIIFKGVVDYHGSKENWYIS